MSLTLLNLPNPPAIGNGKRTELPLGAPYSLGSMASMMIGVRSNSGQFVTPERALRASAVLACIRIFERGLERVALESLPAHTSGRGLGNGPSTIPLAP